MLTLDKSYKASFAPTLDDLTRVRTDVFQLPENIRQLLEKSYSPSFGYVICLLDKSANYHPFGYMHHQFSEGSLWIPTRHQHGKRYEEIFSDWSHNIYTVNTIPGMAGKSGDLNIASHTLQLGLLPKLAGLIKSLCRMELKGEHPNRDLLVKVE